MYDKILLFRCSVYRNRVLYPLPISWGLKISRERTERHAVAPLSIDSGLIKLFSRYKEKEKLLNVSVDLPES